ncbi:MAG: hypothetical protein HYV35_03955 [Lentisphaerae bacterium]|nr:hypothetical protein [Lentisphaerota bacterium]
MIWNAPATEEDAPGQTLEQALIRYIAAEIEPAEAAAPPEAAVCRRELAEAIVFFLRHQHAPLWRGARGVNLSRPSGLPAEYLLLLIGRALWSVGAEQTARRLLAEQLHELNLPAAFMEAAWAPDVSLVHWYLLLSTRALRTSPLTPSAHEPLWVLDLERMIAPGSAGLELLAVTVVHTVIDRVAPLWDHCQGRGLLGLRHAKTIAAGVLGVTRHSAKSTAFANEIRAEVERRLAMLQAARGWNQSPQVIMLDL